LEGSDIDKRIVMMQDNLRNSFEDYNRGNISREQYDRLERDVELRIKELKEERNKNRKRYNKREL
jgi:hypothetical protein